MIIKFVASHSLSELLPFVTFYLPLAQINSQWQRH